jgi:hypothetical protein
MVRYIGTLIGAGWEGLTSARRDFGGRVFTPPLKKAVWAPAVIGAVAGAFVTRMGGKRKLPGLALGGLVGGAVGSGASAAWASRAFTGCAGRRAVEFVNVARDARWLETHPIDYA